MLAGRLLFPEHQAARLTCLKTHGKDHTCQATAQIPPPLQHVMQLHEGEQEDDGMAADDNNNDDDDNDDDEDDDDDDDTADDDDGGSGGGGAGGDAITTTRPPHHTEQRVAWPVLAARDTYSS
jgi:hypothetical protein